MTLIDRLSFGRIKGNKMRDYLSMGHFILLGVFLCFFAACGYLWMKPEIPVPSVETLSEQEILDISGVVNDGWYKDEGEWFYYENGRMAKDEWIDDLYYVGKDGMMLRNAVTPDGYTVGDDGTVIIQ